MKALTVRGVPERVYRTLQQLAHDSRRSLQEQVTLILEREVALVTGSRLAGAHAIRKRLAERAWGSIVADIRQDRAR